MQTTFQELSTERTDSNALLLNALQQVALAMQQTKTALVDLQLVAPNNELTQWALDFHSSIISKSNLLGYALQRINIKMREV